MFKIAGTGLQYLIHGHEEVTLSFQVLASKAKSRVLLRSGGRDVKQMEMIESKLGLGAVK